VSAYTLAAVQSNGQMALRQQFLCQQVVTDQFNIMDTQKQYDAFSDFCKEVWEEYLRATKKHEWKPDRSLTEVACVVAEEMGEVVKAALQAQCEHVPIDPIFPELVQTAAMCFRAMQHFKIMAIRGVHYAPLPLMYSHDHIYEPQFDAETLPFDGANVEWKNLDMDGTPEWRRGIFAAQPDECFFTEDGRFDFAMYVAKWRYIDNPKPEETPC